MQAYERMNHKTAELSPSPKPYLTTLAGLLFDKREKRMTAYTYQTSEKPETRQVTHGIATTQKAEAGRSQA